MNRMKKVWALLMLIISVGSVHADEGMWLLNELNKQNIDRMRELGFVLPYDSLYSPTQNSISDAVVIFGGGCTGIAASNQGLIFTNHHCGFGAIQSQSSVDHDYLKDGFVSQTMAEELPIPGLSVKFLNKTINVTDRIVSELKGITDESARIHAADSIATFLCDSVSKDPLLQASVVPYYNSNVYYMQVYDVFKDVRMVFAPPTAVGKFGGDTDNWMWPRQTGDFSVFRAYANAENKAAEYDVNNKPYQPRYVPEVSLQGYKNNDYAMTIGFPGSTDRYLSSWGVIQRIEDTNKPRIEARGIKQAIWKEAMLASDEVRIKYASKYAGSSNYWKNSIGMNKGLAKLNVIERKRTQEAALAAWLEANPAKKAIYGDVLNLLKNGYEQSSKYINSVTYLSETFISGAEIIKLARAVQSVDENQTTEELVAELEKRIKPIYKDYDAKVDQKALAALMTLAKERIDPEFLPAIYKQIDKKYKGDYNAYAADLFKKSVFTSYDKVLKLAENPKKFAKLQKDPAAKLALSVMVSFVELQQYLNETQFDIAKGERLFFAALKEMYPNKALPSDANFTMRMSYGSVGGYRPYDAAEFDYFATQKGILEKQDPTSDEFYVQPEILELLRSGDFGQYGEGEDMKVCFLSNNDITGGNSGSPVFDKNGRLIGLAFDGNWEAMSGDIAFEPALQRTINVDIRYVLFMIDKWGKCPRLIEELKLVK